MLQSMWATLEENKIKENDPKDSDNPQEAAILRDKQQFPARMT